MTTKQRSIAPTEALQVTSAIDWLQGEVVELPSGKVAMLQTPDVIGLLTQDGETMSLLNRMSTKQASGEVTVSLNGMAEIEFLQAIAPLLDRMVIASFVSPKVGETNDPENNQIAVGQISIIDKMFVFNREMGRAMPVASFRQKQG